MSRIFLSLAIVALAFFCITIGLGLRGSGYNEAYATLMQQERQMVDASRNQTAAMAADTSAARAAIDRLYDTLSQFRQQISLHIIMGVLCSLVTVLVHSISVTYFIGTSRWCKEVVEAYSLDPRLAAERAQWKRRSFPCALSGMLLMVGIVALGAAADPGTGAMTTGNWVLPHFFVAILGCGMTVILLALQWLFIRRNSQVVETILAAVRTVRHERGLAVEG